MVEFALVLPVLMLVLLGFAELGFLIATAHSWQQGADVLAESVAHRVSDAGWQSEYEAIRRDEAQLRRCDGSSSVEFPDGTNPGDRVRVRWTCHYASRVSTMWSMDIDFMGEGVIPSEPVPSTP